MPTSLAYYEASAFDALRTGNKSMRFWSPRLVALAGAIIGPLSLVLDMRFDIPMAKIGPLFWFISAALTLIAAGLAKRAGDQQFIKTLLVAIVAGYMATATYDSSRIAGMSAGFIAMDEAVDFGMRLTGQVAPGAGHGGHGDAKTTHGARDLLDAPAGTASPTAPAGQQAQHAQPTDPVTRGAEETHGETTAPAAHSAQGAEETHRPPAASAAKSGERAEEHTGPSIVAKGATVALGYAWHYWSGIMFACAFLVFFGARRWWGAIPYLVFVIYPGMVFTMGWHSFPNFVWEAFGHAAFGLTLGIVSYALMGQHQAARTP